MTSSDVGDRRTLGHRLRWRQPQGPGPSRRVARRVRGLVSDLGCSSVGCVGCGARAYRPGRRGCGGRPVSRAGQEVREASWESGRGSVASWGLRRARVQEGPSLEAWGSRSGCRVHSRLVTQGRGRGPHLEALEPEPSRASGAAPWGARLLWGPHASGSALPAAPPRPAVCPGLPACPTPAACRPGTSRGLPLGCVWSAARRRGSPGPGLNGRDLVSVAEQSVFTARTCVSARAGAGHAQRRSPAGTVRGRCPEPAAETGCRGAL